MLCSNCKKQTATFFYTQNINGKETSVSLCPDCAQKAGIGIQGDPFSPFFGSLFGGEAVKAPHHKAGAKRCSLCALTFADIAEMGKVGCPECYNTFREELKNTIRSIHGSAKHVGITPERSTDVAPVENGSLSEEGKLREALNIAIQTENYEEAARLRDLIRAQKGE